MTSNDEFPRFPGRQRTTRAALEEQIRRKGVRPVRAVEELELDVFDSAEEVEEFLDHIYSLRRQGTA